MNTYSRKYCVDMWNSNSTGCPVFYLSTPSLIHQGILPKSIETRLVLLLHVPFPYEASKAPNSQVVYHIPNTKLEWSWDFQLKPVVLGNLFLVTRYELGKYVRVPRRMVLLKQSPRAELIACGCIGRKVPGLLYCEKILLLECAWNWAKAFGYALAGRGGHRVWTVMCNMK